MLILYGFIMVLCLVAIAVVRGMPEDKRLRFTGYFRGTRTMAYIKKTDPVSDAASASAAFITHKVMTVLIVVLAGSFLAFMYELNEFSSKELTEGNLIMRNGYGGADKKIRLRVRNLENEEQDMIDVFVSERRYTDEELDIMAAEAETLIYELVIGSNESLDHVCSNMSFPVSLEGYPFKLSWRTDDPLLLNNRGVIDDERLKRIGKTKNIYEGILTGIHVELIYEDYIKEIDFCARIYPSDPDNEYTLSQYMTELIKEEDEATRTEEYLILPESADGIEVAYEEIGDNRAVILFVLTVIVAAGLYYREDRELSEKVKARDEQLTEDYPALVNKFVLFYSAGLTTRGIWSKLCMDYRGRLNNGEEKRYLYEEMLICEGWMNEGLGELSAYEGFAARLSLHKYRQFISLVSQAIGKGRADLLPLLEAEALEAFAERKNRARELGEEAGTKLLFPMLMMLLVVLIIVMVPAFISFRM